MNDDVRKYIYGTLTVFVVGVLVWVGFLFVNACGFTLTCNRGQPAVDRTPIPTLLPATLPVMQDTAHNAAAPNECRVAAVDLIGAWVEVGSPETDVFQFVDASGQNCESTFDEVRSLLIEGNQWYTGSLACVSCHSVDVAVSPAQLDLSTYAGIMAGSRRADAESTGTDILSAGKWDSSLLYEFISTSKADVPGHAEIKSDLLIFAGTPLPAPDPRATPSPVVEATPTPTP
ncbi:MAG: hypothetical protein IH589_03465 [Anaerolineales bacterium]|nr:hypothetical protein [Anaerolineales bacterium]